MQKLKFASTLVEMFGDPVIEENNFKDENYNEVEFCERMLREILLDHKVALIRNLKGGDMFGEQAALRDNKIRTASVRCTEDTHLSYLKMEDFMHIYNIIMKGK